MAVMAIGIDAGTVATDFVVNLTASVAVLGGTIGFRDWLVSRAARVARSLAWWRRYLLVWVDDKTAGGRLTHALDRQFGDITVRQLSAPRAILAYPIRRTRAMVLLDTDVTKLSDDEKLQEKIGDRIAKYAGSGGHVVGSHDLIYRRVRSAELQALFGFEITDFERTQAPVKYERVMDHPLTKNLEGGFELDDGEICWGEWPAAADVVYETKNTKGDRVPLVVAREVRNQGKVVWVNSADKYEKVCPSIRGPQDEFVILLRNALTWTSDSK